MLEKGSLLIGQPSTKTLKHVLANNNWKGICLEARREPFPVHGQFVDGNL